MYVLACSTLRSKGSLLSINAAMEISNARSQLGDTIRSRGRRRIFVAGRTIRPLHRLPKTIACSSIARIGMTSLVLAISGSCDFCTLTNSMHPKNLRNEFRFVNCLM
jgi:hypothetical protein